MLSASHPMRVFPTSDLVAQFCRDIGQQLDTQDTFELIDQCFTVLDTRWALDIREFDVLTLHRFRFLTVHSLTGIPAQIATKIQKAGYSFLVQLYARLEENFMPAVPGQVQYLPYLMVGNDVCLSYFKS